MSDPAHRSRLWMILLPMAALVGCGYSGGEALFMSGLLKRPTIDAEFKLGAGPVAILVDDMNENCYWPKATSELSRQIAKQLTEHKAASVIISQSAVKRLRQSYPNFDQLSYRKVAQLLKAKQAIAVEVRSFFATDDPTSANAAASMSVAVKVLDASPDAAKSKVRLWPRSPGGMALQAEITAEKVARSKTRERILEALTEALAVKIARNFYDRKAEDFERQ